MENSEVIAILTWWLLNGVNLHNDLVVRFLACDLIVGCYGDICEVKWTCPWDE